MMLISTDLLRDVKAIRISFFEAVTSAVSASCSINCLLSSLALFLTALFSLAHSMRILFRWRSDLVCMICLSLYEIQGSEDEADPALPKITVENGLILDLLHLLVLQSNKIFWRTMVYGPSLF